jgi:sugar PTS system EIIA component
VADVVVLAPVAGTVVPLDDVPDPVFATGMVGPGIALVPTSPGRESAIAPVAGVVGALHPHAYVVAGPGGGTASVLVHLGIDTVQLKGRGFTLLTEQGHEVTAGQALIDWSPTEVGADGHSPLVPVIVLAGDPASLTVVATLGEDVAAGDPLLRFSVED